jgi:peroxiredoxin
LRQTKRKVNGRISPNGVTSGWLAVLSVAGALACGGVTPGAQKPAVNPGVTKPRADRNTTPASPVTTTVVEHPPDFELDSTTGGSVRLSDLVGKHVILLDFWATYCDPCLTAMPHLQATYDKYREQGLVVLGISIDGPESVANVRSTVAKLGVEFPILLDDESRVVALYNPRTSAPYSVLIGRDGRILAQQEGFTTGNAALMESVIEAAVSTR